MNNNITLYIALWLAIIACYGFNALMWWRITNHQQHWMDKVEGLLLDIVKRLSFIEGKMNKE